MHAIPEETPARLEAPRALYHNRILRTLAAEGGVPGTRRLRLVAGQAVLRPGQPAAELIFPETAVVSLVCYMGDGTAAGVGLVGPEGLLGLWALLGAPMPPLGAICQTTGEALAMRCSDLRAAIERSPRLARSLDRVVAARLTEFGQSIACARLHQLEPRLARLLLTTAERSGCATMGLTQDFMALLLGVQRPSLTQAIGRLRRDGLVELGRAHVRITDPLGLAEVACECHRVIQDGYLVDRPQPGVLSTRPLFAPAVGLA